MTTQESGLAEASPGSVHGATRGSFLARHRLAMVHRNFAKLTCGDIQIEKYYLFTIIYLFKCIDMRRKSPLLITFKSVLALASEIVLSALAFSTVLARIDGAFVHVNL